MHGSNQREPEQPTPPRRFSLARLAKQPLVIRTPQGCVVIGAEHRDGKRRVTVSVEEVGGRRSEVGGDLRPPISGTPISAQDPLDICSPERLRSS